MTEEKILRQMTANDFQRLILTTNYIGDLVSEVIKLFSHSLSIRATVHLQRETIAESYLPHSLGKTLLQHLKPSQIPLLLESLTLGR